jgi:hypothetical protein
MTHPDGPRYAIYFTPGPLSPLARFGAGVTGYDPAAGADAAQFELDGISGRSLRAATEAPRKYGFHATLVAPFYLNGRSETGVLEGLTRFCAGTGPVPLGPLDVGLLGDFIVLTPRTENPALDELARRCVEFFDSFRAPLTAADLARRSHGRLSARQRAHLDRWGYPYVFEDFRFHMTLTGALTGAEKECFLSALAKAYKPLLDHVYEIDALSLMRQRTSGSRFEVIARRVLQSGGRRA